MSAVREAVDQYLEMQRHLAEIRLRHGGKDSAEEDRHLEAMDAAWWGMTVEERCAVRGRCP